MSIFDYIIAKLAPHTCVGCGQEGSLLCSSCQQNMTTATERCYRCNKATAMFKTCANCSLSSPLAAVLSATKYEGVAKDLITQLKFHGAQASARIMAIQMAAILHESLTISEAIIVPVPTATNRVRERGYDQATLLARELAWITKTPYRECLARNGKTQQAGASRTQRQQQLQHAFWLKRPLPGGLTRVILVDDVLTTGSTVESAAMTLQHSADVDIEAVTFAQA